jgi:hypothetical protein
VDERSGGDGRLPFGEVLIEEPFDDVIRLATPVGRLALDPPDERFRERVADDLARLAVSFLRGHRPMVSCANG